MGAGGVERGGGAGRDTAPSTEGRGAGVGRGAMDPSAGWGGGAGRRAGPRRRREPIFRLVPHFSQKFEPARLSWSHRGHFIRSPRFARPPSCSCRGPGLRDSLKPDPNAADGCPSLPHEGLLPATLPGPVPSKSSTPGVPRLKRPDSTSGTRETGTSPSRLSEVRSCWVCVLAGRRSLVSGASTSSPLPEQTQGCDHGPCG